MLVYNWRLPYICIAKQRKRSQSNLEKANSMFQHLMLITFFKKIFAE